MSSDISTIVSALIGYTGGSSAAAIVSDLLKRKSERKALGERLINLYLIQFKKLLNPYGIG